MLKTIIARVQAAAPDEARLRCEWLASRIMGCSRLELDMHKDRVLTAAQLREIETGTARLAAGEPLQYILGEAEFMGRTFGCDRRALIPRPETEQVTAWLLENEQLWRKKAPAVAELGTGTGCIVITLALERPDGRYVATDISAAALALARENAARHGVSARIRFIACDLLPAAPPDTTFQHSAECWNVAGAAAATLPGLDAVVSNPPYVRTADWMRLDRNVRDFEPREALDGGADGLAIIRRLTRRAFQALRPDGALYLEIGEDQGPAVLELARTAGFRSSRLRRDLAGKDRMVQAVK